jgi:hypothetical protein
VAGERYLPDVAFISKARQPEPSHDTYNPNAPDLAVDVVSPTGQPRDIRIKVVQDTLDGGALLPGFTLAVKPTFRTWSRRNDIYW